MRKQKNLIHLTCTKNNYKGLYITQTAFLQINKIIKKNNSKGIKLFLKKSGCFGFKYNILLLDNLLNNEIIFQKDTICIFINNKDLIFIDGTIINFTKNNFHQSFQFYNSKIKQFCGCKKSFTFK
ncbi:iron-sulfur cluster assembly accessory protein [Enterobacteriaceae endosymbiont of Donacia crassipes]|uniref:iron-sulfur cluster assembly accessory protein n=1 Tax=Enterobacteriaceae endosymbiont of Donacia crassipes TaxID=2675776 RepID=UPI001449CFD3|nr:iron-sulfur cluster assembly accessory protein [Enterobacteriaceae endosymbiont of Donacia crassipes]QJC34637.1 iron-sulfur cluster assembly accessory protein [Enterobacteriaceae endosymbiont of Donacia crassipes]